MLRLNIETKKNCTSQSPTLFSCSFPYPHLAQCHVSSSCLDSHVARLLNNVSHADIEQQRNTALPCSTLNALFHRHAPTQRRESTRVKRVSRIQPAVVCSHALSAQSGPSYSCKLDPARKRAFLSQAGDCSVDVRCVWTIEKTCTNRAGLILKNSRHGRISQLESTTPP
jgi:hypothetical protein